MKPAFIVDGDAHVLESRDGVRARFPERWRTAIAELVNADGGSNRTYFGTLGPKQRPSRPEDYLRDMDVEGIDVSVFYPTTGLGIGQVRDPEWQSVYCRAYNDWLAEFCTTNAGRLKGVALVPLQDTTLACEEMNRAVANLGLVGVMLPSSFSFGPPNLGEAYLDPFYAEAERLGVPVGVHHTGSLRPDTEGFRLFLQIHLLSHVPEQMKALTAIVIGGVLERFPRLKIAFLEAGCGWAPFWLQHMDEEFEKRHVEVPYLKRKPSEYILESESYFGTEPEEKLIPLVAQQIGAEKLIYASDYPHWDSDWPNTVKTLVDRPDMSDELREKLMSDNAARLYGLKKPVPAR